jgi:hypothetical protein
LYYKVQIYPDTYLLSNNDIIKESSRNEIILGGGREEEVDQTDMQIMNIIAYDS